MFFFLFMNNIPCIVQEYLTNVYSLSHDIFKFYQGENILHEITNIMTIVSQFFVNKGDNEQKVILFTYFVFF